jgi:hypothetical protein
VIGRGGALQTTSNDASRDILIDTSQAATDTIDYVATDTWGNTSTSTRTVIIEANPSIIPTNEATTTASFSHRLVHRPPLQRQTKTHFAKTPALKKSPIPLHKAVLKRRRNLVRRF